MTPTEVDLNEWQFDVNAPQFIREAALNCVNGMYVVCWECFRMLLGQVAQRATEIDDPVMNALMLRLNLYECSANKRRTIMRQQIDRYYREISAQQKNMDAEKGGQDEK